MKELLNTISPLDGFISNEEFNSVVSFVDDNEINPPICNDYGLQDDKEFP